MELFVVKFEVSKSSIVELVLGRARQLVRVARDAALCAKALLALLCTRDVGGRTAERSLPLHSFRVLHRLHLIGAWPKQVKPEKMEKYSQIKENNKQSLFDTLESLL